MTPDREAPTTVSSDAPVEQRPHAASPGGTEEGMSGTRPRATRRSGMAIGAAVAGIGLLILAGTGFDVAPIAPGGEMEDLLQAARSSDDPEAERLGAERRRLTRELQGLVPRGAYVIIDQTHNRIRLMRSGKTLLDAPCSAGSGHVLSEGPGGRVWVFDTPRGVFPVISKITNPVWKKPDWAFVEEGEPIPRDPGERFEYGVLGEYALYFGNGFMIHGTLYERLIGRPVSHGCIRVGREPLREIFRSVPVGALVFIY